MNRRKNIITEDAMRVLLKHLATDDKPGNREPTAEEINEIWKFPRHW